MDAANKDVDPADEEAKGGSGMVGHTRPQERAERHIVLSTSLSTTNLFRFRCAVTLLFPRKYVQVGKMLLSSGDKQLALLCYVPPDKQAKARLKRMVVPIRGLRQQRQV